MCASHSRQRRVSSQKILQPVSPFPTSSLGGFQASPQSLTPGYTLKIQEIGEAQETTPQRCSLVTTYRSRMSMVTLRGPPVSDKTGTEYKYIRFVVRRKLTQNQ